MSPTVLIFRSNITTKESLNHAAGCLNTLSGIERWTVDLDDSDCVLRIETYSLCEQDVSSALEKIGIWCEDLGD
ncbi:MAG: hypothetical protein JNN25_19005 [Candidatus Kapabacteria bacterium]|nr:hypothetical protein [Candidatus Kapabacteria bacterium]